MYEEFLKKCYDHASCEEFQFSCRGRRDHIAKRGKTFYYAHEHDTKIYLCKCDDISGKGTILVEAYSPKDVKEYYVSTSYCYVAANKKGIIFAYTRNYDGAPKDFKPELIIKHYDFKGNLISEMSIFVPSTFDGEYHSVEISNFYVYDECFYFLLKKHQIVRINLDTKEHSVVYKSVENSIYDYCVNKNKILINSSFSWAVLDLEKRTIDKLWNQKKNPIHFVNAAFGIAWTEFERKSIAANEFFTTPEQATRITKECVCLKPVALWGPGMGKTLTMYECGEMHDKYWIPTDILSSFDIYFNGINLYANCSYNRFVQVTSDGSVSLESYSNGGHGNCDRFFVTGDRLFLDIDASGTMIYNLPFCGCGNGRLWPIWTPDEKAYGKLK